MNESPGFVIGRVSEIRRYPVKSMLGEELDSAEVTERGLLGDRAYALVDSETGKIASAKNPRRWPNLFDFRAGFVEPFAEAVPLPSARITFPDGESVTTDQPDVEARLSEAVGRPVRLARSGIDGATAEGYWPNHDWLANPDEVFQFPLPAGTFFDEAMIHLLTTATLHRLQALAPESRFDVRRFRPNFVIDPTDPTDPTDATDAFVENDWIGRTITIGETHLRINGPCPRCVMTTLSQGDLPKDPRVLRTIVQGNAGNAGVYASVVRGGVVRRGDAVIFA
ncbi:MOSC N-terminal beta barrel domain-containing protein [Singulisphaera sp. Ch08]|uniref:MOSC N-terminal beta barrel domain-containing protein n=1 Tax=Singulisphaera sp. Ch08 TaxID=3120278 RepID=A0AAU7CBM6_9BACT